MSVNTNLVIIGGNIGKIPELRHTESGRAVLNFSLANDRVRRVGGTIDRKTGWYDITCWDEQAEHNAKHLTKGSEVLVTGRLNVRSYTDRDGIKRRQTEIIASKIDWIKIAPVREEAEDTAPAQLTTNPETVSISS